MTRRLAIFDNVDTPQRFNLIKLLGVILGHLGTGGARWIVRRAEGYGLAINAMNDRLDSLDGVELEIPELLGLLPGIEEWLFWFDAVTEDGSISFGLTDSSFMFVEGPIALTEDVRSCFNETREVDRTTG